MKLNLLKVLYGAAIGVIAGASPALGYMLLKPDQLWYNKLLFVITAGTGAIIGSVAGSAAAVLEVFRKSRGSFTERNTTPREVFYGAGLGGVVGALPGAVYMLSFSDWETWNRDLFYLLLACGAGVMGAVVGSTLAILRGFKERSRSSGSSQSSSGAAQAPH